MKERNKKRGGIENKIHGEVSKVDVHNEKITSC
jgi:hypothetical protein